MESSKLVVLADDNFKLDKNGRKLSKWVENTVGNTRYEQFLLFPQCFQKACTAHTRKSQVLFGKGLKKKLMDGRS